MLSFAIFCSFGQQHSLPDLSCTFSMRLPEVITVMNKGICTFVLHSPHWINESHASGAKLSLSFLKGFDFRTFVPITMLLLTRQWDLQHNIGQNYFYWREMTNVNLDVLWVFQRVNFFMKEKKMKGKKPYTFCWKWNIAVLWFFHFNQTRVGGTQQGSVGDIL